MKTCFCGPSALTIWRHHDNRISGIPVFGHTSNCGPTLESAFPSNRLESLHESVSLGVNKELLEATNLVELGLNGPVDLLVDRSKRGQSTGSFIIHSTTTMPPKGSLLKIKPGLYAVSPEYLYLRSGRDCDFLDQLILGYELTGCYSIRPDLPSGLFQRPPLCSVKSISHMLAKSASPNERKSTALALNHIIDGSGSPRETALAMLLCLPMRYGGFGLPSPKLNLSLDLGKDGALCWNRSNAFDMVWEKERLIVEYDGDSHFESAAARERDALRRNASILADYTILVATKQQLATVEGTYAIALAVAKNLGVQLRFRSKHFQERHEKLRRKVLSAHPSGRPHAATPGKPTKT